MESMAALKRSATMLSHARVMCEGRGCSRPATKVRALYKAHLKALAERVNVFTGVPYMDDPTIFSWGLFNEVRDPDTQMGPGPGQSPLLHPLAHVDIQGV